MEECRVLAGTWRTEDFGADAWYKKQHARMAVQEREENRKPGSSTSAGVSRGEALAVCRERRAGESPADHPLFTRAADGSTAHSDFGSGACGVPSTAPSESRSSSIGTSHFSTIRCMGIATRSTTKKTRLSTAPPWGAVNTVRKPTPRRPGQLGVLRLPEHRHCPGQTGDSTLPIAVFPPASVLVPSLVVSFPF